MSKKMKTVSVGVGIVIDYDNLDIFITDKITDYDPDETGQICIDAKEELDALIDALQKIKAEIDAIRYAIDAAGRIDESGFIATDGPEIVEVE